MKLIDALAVQHNLLALAAALEDGQADESRPDFTALQTQLHHLEEVARETAEALGNACPCVRPEGKPLAG